MSACWQLGVLFSFLYGWGLASSLTSFGFCCGGLFERLGNVLNSEGLAFLVKFSYSFLFFF